MFPACPDPGHSPTCHLAPCPPPVQEGAVKVALYRDEAGKLYRRSALCPHVGCIVEWNPSDKSFDCPCHGSQFDCYGRCIAGPSTVDLEELASQPAPSGPEKPEPNSN